MSIATFCLECIYSLVEYLTKFATVRMAITGEAFFDAARRATDLLTRNFLKVRPETTSAKHRMPTKLLEAFHVSAVLLRVVMGRRAL